MVTELEIREKIKAATFRVELLLLMLLLFLCYLSHSIWSGSVSFLLWKESPSVSEVCGVVVCVCRLDSAGLHCSLIKIT